MANPYERRRLMERRRWWHCRGPFFHRWGYNESPFFPMRGCLRDGCDYVTFDYSEKRIKERVERMSRKEP